MKSSEAKEAARLASIAVQGVGDNAFSADNDEHEKEPVKKVEWDFHDL